MSSNPYKLINHRQLADIGPALDAGGSISFPNGLELLALITQQAGHVERRSAHWAGCVLPGPQRVEDVR